MIDTKCKAKTTSGARCNARAVKGSLYCFTHDPAHAQARALARKRGGERNRTPHGANLDLIPSEITTIQHARQILLYTLQEVLPMENSIARARVLIALFDSYVESIKTGEIQDRITALESILKARP